MVVHQVYAIFYGTTYKRRFSNLKIIERRLFYVYAVHRMIFRPSGFPSELL